MKIWFDTEFQDYGDRVELLSLGAIREDGEEFYAENGDANLETCDPWVQANVIPLFTGPVLKRDLLAQRFYEFSRTHELWGWYVGYDWWLIKELMGGWGKLSTTHQYVGDVKALSMVMNKHQLPEQPKGTAHNALADARWTKAAFEAVMGIAPRTGPQCESTISIPNADVRCDHVAGHDGWHESRKRGIGWGGPKRKAGAP